MTTLYARLNIQLSGKADKADKAAAARRLEGLLHNAAIESSAGDFEVFYLESHGVVGVAVPFVDKERSSLFEAGQFLGYVQCYVEKYAAEGGLSFSTSFVKSDGSLISSTRYF